MIHTVGEPTGVAICNYITLSLLSQMDQRALQSYLLFLVRQILTPSGRQVSWSRKRREPHLHNPSQHSRTMFGPRRNPVLATAAVVGVSRHSAKHEAERQAEAQAQREWEIQQEAERRNRERVEEEARIRRATEAAALKAQSASHPSTAPNPVLPPSYAPQYVSAPGVQPAAAPVRDMQNTRYCPSCGNACEMMDRFCRACGTRQA